MKNEDAMRILEVGPGESLKLPPRKDREERTLKGGLSSRGTGWNAGVRFQVGIT